jgi:hypothetical protein
VSLSPQGAAAAANDAYKDRPASDVDNKTSFEHFDGQKYSVFGYKNDPATGFHGTAYRNVATGEIIIAIRGTDPDWRNHTRTTVQDAAVDFAMVKEQANAQKAAADEFTKAIIDKAQRLGITKEHIFLTGHSLGGTLVEIEAWECGLRGMTFNAYGAVDLIHGVPQGGNQVTNYVMAGDVVSAGSYHFGEVKVLASVQDVAALHMGRYLGAPSGGPRPNPLLTMQPSDHSVTHFTGEGGKENMLAPASLAASEARYQLHKAAFDHFREDIHQDRAELGEALRNMDSRTIVTTMAHLSPRLQQQLLEVHAVAVDAPIHRMVEDNSLVLGAASALDYASALLRDDATRAQQGADEFSHRVRFSGQDLQQKADAIANASLGFSALNPLAAAGAALGATAAGSTARMEVEGLAQASQFAGQATHVADGFAADQAQVAKLVLETGVHEVSQVVTTLVHTQEFGAVVTVDAALILAQATHTAGDRAVHAFVVARDAVSQAVEATRQVADRAYGALGHPAQWFTNGSSPVQAAHESAQVHSPLQPAQTSDATHALNDPRHPANRDHGLYSELHRRIPDASEKRLLQFTDACHTNKITVKNLGQIHLDEKAGHIFFMTSWPPQPPAVVDLKHPSPDPQQSINHIHQHDQQQAPKLSQHAQVNLQGQAPLQPQAPAR